jgi:hypothetical protein
MDNNEIQACLSKIFDDENLSHKAKGIYFYIISHLSEEINTEKIIKASADGITSTRSGIEELIKSGYIKFNLVRNEKKQVIKSYYQVCNE